MNVDNISKNLFSTNFSPQYIPVYTSIFQYQWPPWLVKVEFDEIILIHIFSGKK